jgi:hypothetical protein
VILPAAQRAAAGRSERRRAVGSVRSPRWRSLWLAPPRIERQDTLPYCHFRFSHAATGREYHVMAPSEGVAALLGIWGLVAVAARAKRRALAGPPALALATALLTLASACAPAPERRVAETSLPHSSERALVAHLANAGCPARPDRGATSSSRSGAPAAARVHRRGQRDRRADSTSSARARARSIRR